MSSTDLNAVVAHSATPGVGVAENERGVPDEELAYLASDSYAQALSRSQSPELTRGSIRPALDGEEKRDEDGNVIHVEDPAHGPGYLRRGNSDYATSRAQSHHPDEEQEEEEPEQYSILAEDEVPKRQQSQYMQAAVYTPSYTPRHPRSRPASALGGRRDDVEGASLALATKFEKSGEPKDPTAHRTPHDRTPYDRTPYDRTPYEELSPADENAKPLFPDSDDEKAEAPKNPSVEKFKRPGLSEHRFPSNDVWEEAPDHAQLEATVETPPVGEAQKTETTEEYDHEEEAPRKKNENEPKLQYIRGQPHEHFEPGDEQEFERKEKEAARKDTDYHLDLKDLPEDERLHRLHKNTDSDRNTPESSSSRRSAQRKKFPSNDIWEEVPPSQDLQEELDESPVQEKESPVQEKESPVQEKESPVQEKEASVPEKEAPVKERATTGDISTAPESSARPTTGAPIEPSVAKPTVPPRPAIPARPKKFVTIPERPEAAAGASAEKKAPPAIPDRPKPHVPARPIGKLAGFIKVQNEDAPEPKPKPPVPPRSSTKIAALKAGLGDLESRLKFGPMGPPPKKEEKKEEPVKEEPLTDVRKSRARGPRGRKLPTKEEKPTAAAIEQPKGSEFVGVWTVYTLDADLHSVLVNPEPEKPAAPVTKEDTKSAATEDEKPASESAEKTETPITAEPVLAAAALPETVPTTVATPETASETKTEEAIPEPKVEEATLETKAEEATPEATAEVIPEAKATEAISEAKSEEAIPEAKAEDVTPETKAEEVTPEAKAEEAAPEAKPEAAEVNTTAIPTDEHPEDAVAPTKKEVETPEATPEVAGDAELKQPEKVGEETAEERVTKEN
jgi:hypothetical protein